MVAIDPHHLRFGDLMKMGEAGADIYELLPHGGTAVRDLKGMKLSSSACGVMRAKREER